MNRGAARDRGGGRGRGGHPGGRGGGFQGPPRNQALPKTSPQIPMLKPLTAEENLQLPPSGALIPLEKPKPSGTVAVSKVECHTNFYELILGKKYSVAYFYTVTIRKQEKCLPKNKKNTAPMRERKLGHKMNLKIFNLLNRRELGEQLLAYDGRGRACGFRRIPNDGLIVTKEFDGDIWHIELSFEKSVELAGLRAGEGFAAGDDLGESLLALALIMNHMPSLEFTPLGRGFYELPGFRPTPMSGGFELVRGYKARVLLGSKKLFFNLNHAVTAFVKPGPLIQLLPELLDLRPGSQLPQTLSERDIDGLENKLKKCRAKASHLQGRRPFTIGSITRRPASKIMFEHEGRQVSVADYFAKAYARLRYPNLPCVQVGQKEVFLPFEFVVIEKSNPFRGDQTPQMVREIIKQAAIVPSERLAKIRETLGLVDSRSPLREFDMKIDKELEVQARVIPPPRLSAGQNAQLQVTPGVINFLRSSFASGGTIQNWTIVITDERARQDEIAYFEQVFSKQAANMGLTMKPVKKFGGSFHFISDRIAFTKFEKELEKFVKDTSPDFILFIIGNQSPVHAAIKYVCDVVCGVSSKCIKSATVSKVSGNDRPGPDQVVLNVMYGLNPKFSGENVRAMDTEFVYGLLTKSAVLVIGIDVNHGQAKDRAGVVKMPSTVGIVGTRNRFATLYTAFMRAQRKPPTSEDREVVQAVILKPAVRKIFVNFFKQESRKPERVIVYRDGVSDGQFQAVLDKEFRAIAEVCSELEATYRPPITFVTVQKRHEARIFPKNVDPRSRANQQNPTAGTVVEEGMPNPKVRNFYMVTHEGIQGTSRPAHYSVLRDENDFSNDQLQSLSYYLCHQYSKCPRSVSIPAPIYYAHWVAFRAAEIGKYQFVQSAHASSNFSRRLPEEVEEEEQRAVQIFNEATNTDDLFSTSMYFL